MSEIRKYPFEFLSASKPQPSHSTVFTSPSHTCGILSEFIEIIIKPGVFTEVINAPVCGD